MRKGKYLVVVVLVGVLGVAGVSGRLGVNRVEVEIKGAPCIIAEQAKADSELLDKNILLLNTAGVSEKLSGKYPCVKSVRVKQEFPKTARLIIEGRVALARLSSYTPAPGLDLDNLESSPSSESALLDWSISTSSGQQFLADDEGVLFAVAEGEGLPTLFFPETPLRIGQKVGGGMFQKIADIFIGLGKMGAGVSGAKVVRTDLLVQTPQKIAFSLERDIRKQLVSLQLILQKAKIDGKGFDTIDLRFDKPVVKFLPKK